MKDISNNDNPFFSIGINYIKFAQEKFNLFRFLYLFDIQQEENLFVEDDKCFLFFKENLKLTHDEAKKFYESLWIFTHGLAVLVSTNSYTLSNQQIEEHLKFTFHAMYEKILNERRKALG